MNHQSKSENPIPGMEEEKQFLNIAAICPSTQSFGPGKRAAIWVQGCVFHCPGCIAPDLIPIVPARLVSPEDILTQVLSDPEVTGLTFSGGEPMLQAQGLATLTRLARSRRSLDIICFTGFQFENLLRNPPGPGVDDLLAQIDVLIDGPYIERLNNNRGLRGSQNQRIHHLSDRLRAYDFENQPRTAEIHLLDGEIMLVGVPPTKTKEAFAQAIEMVNGLTPRVVQHERI